MFCPLHEADGGRHKRSVTVKEGREGALVECHAKKCPREDVVKALGLTMADLFNRNNGHEAKRREVCAYDYTDETGKMLYQVVRFEPKDFRQRRPDGAGGHVWDMKGVRRVLYRLPDVIATVADGGTVYVVEGERDAHSINTMEDAGSIIATTNPGGAGKWRAEFSETLRGATVVIVADRDEPGRAHARAVASSLEGIAKSIRIVEAKEGKDAHDHLVRGHNLADLVPVEQTQPEQKPAQNGRPLPVPVNLYSVPAMLPEFTVERFVRRRGLHVIWSAPGVGKTFTALRVIHELMMLLRRLLFNHPKLEINRRYHRVLWVGCEEDAGTLRSKADMVLRGLGHESLPGELMFLWAADPKAPITLLDLDKILEERGPFDAVVVDTLTGLLPPTMGGEPVRWDADNGAVTTICLYLRGLAATRDVDLFLIHHTGRDTARGYRGPVAWWGACDQLIGFTPNDDGGITITVEKCRDAGRVPPFILTPTWSHDEGFRLAYDGAAPIKALSPTSAAVNAVLRDRGKATQVELCKATGRNRSSVQPALTQLCRIGLARLTGIAREKSPEYEAVRQDEGRPPQ